MLIQAHAGALSDFVRSLSKVVFPRHKENISCYVYRHQLSADLKASCTDSTAISMALGHSSDETRRYYGSAHCGVARNRLAAVRGTQPVREKTPSKIRFLRQSRERGLERGR
jgi:integrase